MKQTLPLSRLAVVATCVALAGLTWIVFGQTLRHDFVNYDDESYIHEDPRISSGLTRPGLLGVFSHTHASNWHPLTSISHMLDCQLYGLNAGGHHLTNVLLHTLAVVLLFLLLQQMTGALWRSAFVAAVFAIHPLRVESVAWVAERKDVLSGVFFMLTLLAYVRYVSGKPSILRYWLVGLFFALGLMAKSMLVTLPFVLLLLDYWPLRRFGSDSLATAEPVPGQGGSGNGATFARRSAFSRLVAEKQPLLFLSIFFSVVTWWAQRAAMRTTDDISLLLRIENALVSYVRYLWQLLWPTDLALFYPHPRATLPLLLVIAAILLLVAISVAVLRFGQKLPYLITGWGWYLIMLLPVIGLVQVGAQAHADRYTYLPHIGIVLAITWAVADATAGIRRLQRAVAVTAVAVIVALAWRASDQTRYWRNSESIWLHTLAVTKNNEVAHNDLGHVWLKSGRVDDAIREFQAALKISPEFVPARNNLGLAFLKKGRVTDAIEEFRRALAHDPQNVKCRLNLGAAFLESGRVTEAVMEYEKAVALRQDSAQGHLELGHAYIRAGRLAEARAQFKMALQLRPRSADAEYNLGRAEILDGRAGEAIPHLERSVALEPANISARNTLAAALGGKQQWNQAIRHWRETLKINPDDITAQVGLAWTFATAPDPAVRNGAEALAISQRLSQTPEASNPMLLRVLAAAYAEMGRFAEAVETVNRGIALATSSNQAELAARLRGDLKLFQSGQPARDAGESPAK